MPQRFYFEFRSQLLLATSNEKVEIQHKFDVSTTWCFFFCFFFFFVLFVFVLFRGLFGFFLFFFVLFLICCLLPIGLNVLCIQKARFFKNCPKTYEC